MALSKIQSESVNLADDFAFSGTVTGAGETNNIVPVFSTTLTSNANDISWTGATDAYKQYFGYFFINPTADSELRLRIANSSNGFLNGSTAYGFGVINENAGNNGSLDNSTFIRIRASGGGAGSLETYQGSFEFLESRNASAMTSFFSKYTSHDSGANHVGGYSVGSRRQAAVENGFRLFPSSGSFSAGSYLKIYGVKE